MPNNIIIFINRTESIGRVKELKDNHLLCIPEYKASVLGIESFQGVII